MDRLFSTLYCKIKVLEFDDMLIFSERFCVLIYFESVYSKPPPKDWAFSTAFFEAGSISAQSLFVLWLSPTNENFTTLFAYKKPTILVSFWYLKQVFSRLFQYLCLPLTVKISHISGNGH